MEITGEHFNALFEGVPFYKFTPEDEISFGFEYSTGLNVDTVPFKPEGECQEGGLYFTNVFCAGYWVTGRTWVREVTVPPDARVYIERRKYKADKLILGPRSPIEHFTIPDEYADEAIRENPMFIALTDRASPTVLSQALYVNPFLLPFVKRATEEMAMLAVSRYGCALKGVPHHLKTGPVCLKALQRDFRAILFLPDNPELLVELFCQLNAYKNAIFGALAH